MCLFLLQMQFCWKQISVEFVGTDDASQIFIIKVLFFMLTSKESGPHIKIVDANTWSYRQKTFFANFRSQRKPKLRRIWMSAMLYVYIVSIDFV